jgi:hypothetical protein
MEERIKYIIHENLKSGGGITETKGHGQELIVTLMHVKYSLGNVFLFHTYLVVARMKVNFSKVLSPGEFSQKVMYDRNEKFVLDGKFVEDMKIKTHVSSAFIIEEHEYM